MRSWPFSRNIPELFVYSVELTVVVVSVSVWLMRYLLVSDG
jgi:hypothetical protein